MYKFSVRALHLAYDFNTSKADNLNYPHDLRLVTKRVVNELEYFTDYLGGFRQGKRSKQIANYDKNEKLIYRNELENELLDFANRNECRLVFKIGELYLSELVIDPLNDKILKQLKRYIIIPSISDMRITAYKKRTFKALKRNVSKLKEMSDKDRKQLRATAVANKYDIVAKYKESANDLFKPFKLPCVIPFDVQSYIYTQQSQKIIKKAI